MDGTSPRHVGKRLVIHVGGFDPVDAERLNYRIVSGLKKLGPLWNISAEPSQPELSADSRVISWQVKASGPNWSTETVYTVLRWDDLIARYMQRPWWRKIVGGFAALLHFIANGTIWRYFAANGRYGMFVLYPFLLFIAFAAVSIYIGRLVAGGNFPLAGLAGVVVGVALFTALLVKVGQYFHFYFALADWRFAADLAMGNAPEVDHFLDQFADEVVARVGATQYDEVILSGVSLGAVMMAETLARALERDPELCRRGSPVEFLTIGSSILKIGLHPGSAKLKAAIERIVREPDLYWIEYQSKVDPISFFGTDPVAKMGLSGAGKPIVKTVRIRETMTPEEYRYLKINFLRLHRQFAMPNSRRYHYDFYLICFGPMSLPERVELGRHATEAIDEEGRYHTVEPHKGGQSAMMAAQ